MAATSCGPCTRGFLPADVGGERIDVAPETWLAARPHRSHHRLREAVERWLLTHIPADHEMREALLNDVPKRWERLNDLVLLPNDAFASPVWKEALSASERPRGLRLRPRCALNGWANKRTLPPT